MNKQMILKILSNLKEHQSKLWREFHDPENAEDSIFREYCRDELAEIHHDIRYHKDMLLGVD